MRLSIDSGSILVQDTQLDATNLDGRVVVLSVRAGAYFDFSPVASEIWNMLTRPRRVVEIFDTLAQSHEVDAATLPRDVLPFLQTLIDERLVRLVDEHDSR